MDDRNHKEERKVATGLVKRIAEGDRTAEIEMVQRYSRGLLFLLRRKTRGRHEAEDLLQETWKIALETIRKATKPEDPGRLAGYLAGIAKNLASGEHRRAERQKTDTDTDLIDAAKDSSSSPFNQLMSAEACRHVRNMLDELTQDRDREILYRFYVREEDKELICRDLRLDGTHFNRVLFRARQRLKELILRDEKRSRLKVIG